GFYSENKALGPDGKIVSMSHKEYMLKENADRLRDVKAMGAKNIEMENGTIFTLGNLFNLRTGAICIVSDVVPWHPTDKTIDFERNMSECIGIGIDALRTLIKWDKEKGPSKFWTPKD
ncbi:MAG: hypothetical protein OEV21_06125, partial [Thermoplasmata archaeon]|nr:hypothetical protein [Thermoplasmata archaeon]